MINKRPHRITRHYRIRKKISGTDIVPRLAVFRSNKYIYAQLVNDLEAKIITAASSLKSKKKNKIEEAREVGSVLAKAAIMKKVKRVVFDRGGFKYHGRVKALAESARREGLVF